MHYIIRGLAKTNHFNLIESQSGFFCDGHGQHFNLEKVIVDRIKYNGVRKF